MNSARIDTLLEMLSKEPEDLFLTYALGLEYLKNDQQLDMAAEQFRKVITKDASYHAAYYQLGKLEESRNNNAEALRLYKSGLQIVKQKNIRRAAGEFEEAIFMLED